MFPHIAIIACNIKGLCMHITKLSSQYKHLMFDISTYKMLSSTASSW